MAACAEFRQSVEVDAPIDVANEDWTKFIFYSLYYGSRLEFEPDDGFVRMESVGEGKTKVSVDLNVCSDYQNVGDPAEISRIESDLTHKLELYKSFVERSR